MARSWSEDNPKAALMTRKRAAIVGAALRAFLDNGYAESSVNRIAADAGVSIKTLYRHFENKDDLFSAVMEAACATSGGETTDVASSNDPQVPHWFDQPPAVALPVAGREYLRHTLSDDQLALYRVVTRDAHRFPELGRRYREEVIDRRDSMFVAYLDRWLPLMGWTVADKLGAAAIFAALLKAQLFESALYGHRKADEKAIAKRARDAAASMLTLFGAGRL